MAEILLSLTIIGVVAAITLPSLTGNINERAWNTQRKALYARISQAISLMPAVNGYGTLTATTDNAAETFVTAGLAKVLKINNICDSEHLSDCGIPSSVNDIKGTKVFSSFPKSLIAYNPKFSYSSDRVSYSYSQLDTKVAAFETANGESVVAFYNPYCIAELDDNSNDYIQPRMCVNFLYDLNGLKGPNTMGKDIGYITVLYASDSRVVASLPVTNRSEGQSWYEAGNTCREMGSDFRLPNMDELAALFYNKELMRIINGDFWSSSSRTAGTAYVQDTEFGIRYYSNKGERHSLWCVKR